MDYDNLLNSSNQDIFNDIYIASSKDFILNSPGQFYFSINRNSEYNSNKRLNLNKKEMKKITDNIILVFEQIYKSLKSINNCNEEIKELNILIKIIKKLEKFVINSKNTFRFPGLQVVNFTKNMLKPFCLNSDRILICEKSDGIRYLLIVFKNGKYLFFNRRDEFYLIDPVIKIPINTCNSFSKDEWEIEHLLDGELILDNVDCSHLTYDQTLNHLKYFTNLIIIKGKKEDQEHENISKNCININNKLYKMKYIIFDAIVIKRENIGHLNFKNRLEKLNQLGKEIEYIRFSKFYLSEKFVKKFNSNSQNSNFNKTIKEYTEIIRNYAIFDKYMHTNINNKNKTPSVDFYIKDYYTFDKMHELYDISKSFNHENDGIILNYDDYPYYQGTSDEVFKWKPAHLNTIDFEIKEVDIENNSFIVLNVNEREERILPVSLLFFLNEEEKESFYKEYNKVKFNTTNLIAECYYDKHLITDETINFHLLIDQQNKFMNNVDSSINLFYYKSNFVDLKINEYKINNNSNNVNFLKNYELGGWKFLRFRNDKTNANFIKTYKNIVQTIKEDLDIETIKQEINFTKKLMLNTPLEVQARDKSKYLTGNSNFIKTSNFLETSNDFKEYEFESFTRLNSSDIKNSKYNNKTSNNLNINNNNNNDENNDENTNTNHTLLNKKRQINKDKESENDTLIKTKNHNTSNNNKLSDLPLEDNKSKIIYYNIFFR